MVRNLSKWRLLASCSTVVAWTTLLCLPVNALVVASDPVTGGTTIAPADDPGWNYFTSGGGVSANYIYLGNGWALSARHVHGTGAPPGATLTFASGTYVIDDQYVVHNPAAIKDASSQQIALTPEADLRLVHLSGNPSMTPTSTIATQTPPQSGSVDIIGHGRSRESNQTQWNSSFGQVNPPVDPANSGPVAYTGYKALDPNDDTKRWGTNQIADANNYSGQTAFYKIVSTTTGILRTVWGDGVTRDTLSFATSFDAVGGNEAQAVDKDSGSAVFYKRGTNWELAGIVNQIFTYSNQPVYTAVFGDATVIADLARYNQPYYQSICDIMHSCGSYSIAGDVNLDGIVSGDGSGPAATDDVTAFVGGWRYNNGVGKGDYTSWSKGDLNLDGRVDVSDFLLLRSAFNTSGSGASLNSLAALLGGGHDGVPEPSSILLAVTGAAWLALFCRRSSALSAR